MEQGFFELLLPLLPAHTECSVTKFSVESISSLFSGTCFSSATEAGILVQISLTRLKLGKCNLYFLRTKIAHGFIFLVLIELL